MDPTVMGATKRRRLQDLNASQQIHDSVLEQPTTPITLKILETTPQPGYHRVTPEDTRETFPYA